MDLSSCLRGARRVRVQYELDAILFQDGSDCGGHVEVLPPEYAPGGLDNGYAAAEAAEHLPEFQGDVAPSQNDQMIRHGAQFHDGTAVEERQVLQAVKSRHGRPRTSIDEDSLAGQYALAAVLEPNEHGLGAGETGCAENQLQICRLFKPCLTAIAKAVHDVALAPPDAFHIDVDVSCVNAIAGASPREIRDAGACDHGFRRRATFIDAGSTDMLAFYQRRSKARTCKRHTQRRTALPCTDDDRLVLIGRTHREHLRLGKSSVTRS